MQDNGDSHSKSKVKYSPSYCKLMLAYFNESVYEMHKDSVKKKRITANGDEVLDYERVASDPPLFEVFAKKIMVTTKTLTEWRKFPEFDEAYEKCLDMQRTVLITNSLHGLYNPVFSRVAAINIMQWKDGSKDISSTVKKGIEDLTDKDLAGEIDKRVSNISNAIPFQKASGGK